jgi:hypothetical protein
MESLNAYRLRPRPASPRRLGDGPSQDGRAGFPRALAIRRNVIIEVVMGAEPVEPHSPHMQPGTWNDPVRIGVHRQLTPSARIALMIEASRAVLRFARGRRVDER